MAYDDTLFQLGMDLTRSSTAQKEDHGETAHVAHIAGVKAGYDHEDRKDFVNGIVCDHEEEQVAARAAGRIACVQNVYVG